MKYDVLGLLIADRCNFRCDHCCTESDGSAEAALSLEEALRAIDEAAAIPTIREIGISGGEPFLARERLTAIVRHAHAQGFTVAVTTNGYWARERREATSLLERLRDDGLRCVSLSVSQFHLRFTSPARLRLAAEASLAAGLTTRINCIYTNSFSVADATLLFGHLAAELDVVAIPCLPVGRAATAVSADDFPVRGGSVRGSCAKHFTKLAVTASGDLYPCCSPGGFTAPLRLGNIRSEGLGPLHERARQSFLLSVLDDVGPEFFAPFITERLGHAALARPFVDQCHLCHTILSDERMCAIALEAVARLRRELRDETCASQPEGGENSCPTSRPASRSSA